MTKTLQIEDTTEAWEDGSLGRSEEHIGKASGQEMDDLNEAMGSRPVSIRLKESMITDLKMLATHEGLGYQTLIKNLLDRYIVCEFKMLAREQLKEKANEKADHEEPYELKGSPFLTSPIEYVVFLQSFLLPKYI